MNLDPSPSPNPSRKRQILAAPHPPPNLESTSSSDGSSDSSSDSETASKPNKNVNSKNLASEESEESDSSSDEDSGAQVNAKDAAQVSAVNAEDSSSEESDSGSESDDEDDGGKMAVARANGQDKDSTSQTSRTQWLNNSDFMLRKASSNNPGKEVADFFSNANLEGKQVWYFTAPASLPITVLKDMEIDLSKATNGGPLLTHNGDNYGLDIESYATNTQIQLLIPSSGGDKYTSLNHGIDSTVHLRRMAKFGPGGEVHATATDNYVPVPKPIREQPEGLRVRYTPIGVPSPTVVSAAPTKTASANAPGSQAKTKVRAQSSSSESDSESDSDVEMTTPPPSTTPTTRKKLAKSSMSNGDRKRKHSGEEDQTAKRLKAQKTPDVPSTKKHTTAQDPNAAANANATPSKKPSTKSKDKKKQVKKEKTPKPTAATPTAAKQTPIPLPSYPGMKR
ncbi:hypothetical protein NUW58_g10078 [Xylaria curta]|uniref:Uncharacterized protein n=1 Tax=Xylaria curta TaxID=42375 RepID=A0ACC1MR33_9PEZI|nr:hypothetical protein NUW58_g10078 [Xylaria curta]